MGDVTYAQAWRSAQREAIAMGLQGIPAKYSARSDIWKTGYINCLNGYQFIPHFDEAARERMADYEAGWDQAREDYGYAHNK